MKYIAKKVILFSICVFLNLFCSKIIQVMADSSQQIITIGSFAVPVFSIQGVITSFRSLVCILLLFINYKVGIVLALFLLATNIFATIIPIVQYHTFAPVPGVISSLISLVAILTIYSFYRRAVVSSYADFVTGVYNRRRYVYEAEKRLSKNKPFSLACIEIEGFKAINGMFGILAGDYILKHTAQKFSRIAGKNAVVFKITGAMFAIIFDESNSEESSLEKLKQIIETENLKLPNKNENERFDQFCTISFVAGINHIKTPFHEKTASSILKDTETALFAAASLPEEKICKFDESLENQEIKQKEAELLILESLEKDYFYLVYQPQFTTSEKKLRGFEVLIRCKKPDGSIVSPALFIPAAEKTNLIMKIDDFVLRRALIEGKKLLGSMKNDCIISINVSAKNIAGFGFAEKVKTLLSETGFPAKNLEIEITEYSFADSAEKTVANILALKELGVQVALDDFGTGYTSIAQLMKLPINLLKIDKSLIDDIETSQTVRDMVDSVIYMGHVMNCEVISEGVENENQLKLLKEHKCDFIQGFVWGRPQSFSDAEKLCSK